MLLQNKQIRISVANKGGAIVVQDVEDYVRKAWYRQLQNALNHITLSQNPTDYI